MYRSSAHITICFISDLLRICSLFKSKLIINIKIFLFFIYDLPFFINSVASILFADDTTFFKASDSLEDLNSTFTYLLKKLFEWCKHNRIDSNVSKTFIMFITRRWIALLTEVICGDLIIKVVERFKL